MGKITIIGDVHGKWAEYGELLARTPGRTIQIGDMGAGFGRRDQNKIPGTAENFWFRGNHDNPAECYRNVHYLGDWGFMPADNLFWLAGGFSIDRAYRVSGVSWWADEELSMAELQKVIDRYIEVKPRFMLSHEAPSEAAKYMLNVAVPNFRPEKLECTMSRTAEAMQVMLDAHKPEKWIFGHYHVNKTFPWKGTEFTCVAELSTYELETESSAKATRFPEGAEL